MEKRARFRSRWLPYVLIAPQLAITLVFFFLPASQALYQSLLVQDAFGTNTQFVWVLGPESNSRIRVKAMITDRVGPGVAFMPYHFGGWWQGEDRRKYYPPGTDPIVLGESANTVTTYGYDPVTFMQETKVTLCQIRGA